MVGASRKIQREEETGLMAAVVKDKVFNLNNEDAEKSTEEMKA